MKGEYDPAPSEQRTKCRVTDFIRAKKVMNVRTNNAFLSQTEQPTNVCCIAVAYSLP